MEGAGDSTATGGVGQASGGAGPPVALADSDLDIDDMAGALHPRNLAGADTVTILEQLKRDEGRRTRPYQDSNGIWTVGYGHNLTVGALSEAAISQILADDLLAADTACRTLPVFSGLSPARQGVLLNMVFNLGLAGFRTFERFYAALESADYEQAARDMLDSDWASQVGARATRLALQMRTDAWV